jgi:hypothetical protein
MTAIGPGTRVVCIATKWVSLNGPMPQQNFPSYGQIVVVDNIFERAGFGSLLSLVGFRGGFRPESFRPLDGDAEIERLRALIADKPKLTVGV